MSVNNSTEQARVDQEQGNTFGKTIAEESEKDAPLKITSPKLQRSTLLQVAQNDKRSSSRRMRAGPALVGGNNKGDMDVTESGKSNTDSPSSLKWRLIGPYQDLRLSRCRRIYARTTRKDDLALFYHNGRFYAMEAWCSHMGGPLFEGEIEDYNGKCHVMCPWHSYMFDLATGRNEIGLQQYVPELKYEEGMVYVKYHTEVSTIPCQKPSDNTLDRPEKLNSSRKVSKSNVIGRARKESVLESVMKLGQQDGQ